MPFRRIWTQDEDKVLKYLKQDLNIQKWSIISEKLQNQYGIFDRNQKQCRQRYHNHLDSSLNLAKLSAHQEKLLLNLHNRFGNRWAEITKHFGGRTDALLKNFFHSKIRKAIRKLNRYAREKGNEAFKPHPLNIVCKIMENSYPKFIVDSDQITLESELFKKLQNGLIQYSGSAVASLMFNEWSERKTFEYLRSLLDKTLEFQNEVQVFETYQISEQSDYFPQKEKKSRQGKKYIQRICSKQNVAWQDSSRERDVHSSDEKCTLEGVGQGLHSEQITVFPMKMLGDAQSGQCQHLQIQHKNYSFERNHSEVVDLKSNEAFREVLKEIICDWEESRSESISEPMEFLDWETFSVKSHSGEQLFEKMIEQDVSDMMFF